MERNKLNLNHTLMLLPRKMLMCNLIWWQRSRRGARLSGAASCLAGSVCKADSLSKVSRVAAGGSTGLTANVLCSGGGLPHSGELAKGQP